MFSHVVIFWTDPSNPKATDELIAGAERYLKPIPGMLHFHVGRMVPSPRPVVEQSYQVALNTVFPSQEAREAYRAHSRHKQFEEEVLRKTYRKCVVYDFE